MTKKKTINEKKQPNNTIPECAYCAAPTEYAGISGQTAVGKNDALISFVVCQSCYDKMRNTHVEATKVVQHRKKFWDTVQANVRKRGLK